MARDDSALVPARTGRDGAAYPAQPDAGSRVRWSIASVVAHGSFAFAINRFGATRAPTFLYAVPLVTIVVAVLLLGEWPHPLAMVGAAVGLAGVALVQRRGSVRVLDAPRQPASTVGR